MGANNQVTMGNLSRIGGYSLGTLILFFVFCVGSFSQPIVHRDTVIIYRRCPPTLTSARTFRPRISVARIMVDDSASLEFPPSVTGGLTGIQQSLMYPDLAVRAGLSGTVTVQTVVDEKGKPTDVRVVRSTGEIFNEPCVSGVQALSFHPGQKEGRPARSTIQIPIVFSVETKYEILEKQNLNISKITLYHGPGLGGGPNYSIELDSSGSATYTGRAEVDRIGLYRGTVSRFDFSKVVELLSWFCLFDSTKDRYTSVLDVAYDAITVVHDGREQRLCLVADNDVREWGIARIIDQLSSEISWEQVDDPEFKK